VRERRRKERKKNDERRHLSEKENRKEKHLFARGRLDLPWLTRKVTKRKEPGLWGRKLGKKDLYRLGPQGAQQQSQRGDEKRGVDGPSFKPGKREKAEA